MKYNLPRGCYDLAKSDKHSFNTLIDVLLNTGYSFGYQPLDTPIFEETALFHRAVGESSDIVKKETFDLETKGSTPFTLRPEFTAGIMRAIVSNKFYADPDLPLKLIYSGPVFRYERPQKGRYRQFNQLGVETVGVSSPFEDAHVIILGYKMYIEAFKYFGMTSKANDFYVKLNFLGDETTRSKYKERLKGFLADKIFSMCPDCQARYLSNPLRILDCKITEDQTILKGAPIIKEDLSLEQVEYYNSIKEILTKANIKFIEDDNLVRGLDYYSKIVFEYYSTSYENLGALGAGGHYDKLLEEIGGPSLEGVGFSIGLERLYELVKEKQFTLDLDYYLATLLESNDDYAYANKVFALLVKYHYLSDINYRKRGLSAQIKTALRKNARNIIILGSEEVEKQLVVVKDVSCKEQQTMTLAEFEEMIKR